MTPETSLTSTAMALLLPRHSAQADPQAGTLTVIAGVRRAVGGVRAAAEVAAAPVNSLRGGNSVVRKQPRPAPWLLFLSGDSGQTSQERCIAVAEGGVLESC